MIGQSFKMKPQVLHPKIRLAQNLRKCHCAIFLFLKCYARKNACFLASLAESVQKEPLNFLCEL